MITDPTLTNTAIIIERNGQNQTLECESTSFPRELSRILSSGPDKTILLKGVAPDLAQLTIFIGWINKCRVAIIDDNIDKDSLQLIRNHLGKHVFLSSGKETSPTPVTLPAGKYCLNKYTVDWKEHECSVILFTSGSTGHSKGVCHSLGNIVRSARLFYEHFTLTSDDHIYCLAPLPSMSGFRSMVLPMITPVEVTFHPIVNDSFLSIIKQIQNTKPTKILSGPVFVNQVAAYGKRLNKQLASTDTILSTGAELSTVDREKIIDELGITVLNFYGLTETAGIVCAESPTGTSKVNFPPPCKGVSVTLDPQGESEFIFHLSVSSENLFLGYLGGSMEKCSSLQTGDLVRMEAEGGLTYLGRSDDSYKAPSTNWLYPSLLENWLKEKLPGGDVVVRATKVPGGHRVEIWIDYDHPIDRMLLEKNIIEIFGHDYLPRKWHNSTIIRSPLGKVLNIS